MALILADGHTMQDIERRQRSWRLFQIVFCFVYVGVVLDIVTTALGYMKAGNQYEQNPLGGGLISHIGWFGLLALLTLLCVVCYRSVRLVYARMSIRWSRLINGLMLLIAAFRWLAVVTAILYLLQPLPHH